MGQQAGARRSVSEWFRYAESRFRRARLHFGHGTHSAAEEAAWLISATAAIDFGEVHDSNPEPLTAAQRRRASLLIETRIRTRTPLAYLLGEAWLAGHRFRIDRRVIVPRSFIAGLIAQRFRPWLRPRRRVGNALDMCTGSGCLAVLLALAFPSANVAAVDNSSAALAVARRNIRDYGLDSRVRAIRSDLFDALEGRRFDLIVANPPYVDRTAMGRLPREYRHEPPQALAGGRDGLDLIRRILDAAPRFLTPEGLLIVESGRNRRAVEKAFPNLPFTWPETGDAAGAVFLLERNQLSG